MDALAILNVYVLCILVFMYLETLSEYCSTIWTSGLKYDFDMHRL